MAVVTGQRATYTDSANEAIDMSAALDLLHPTDVPLLKLIGRDSLRDPVRNTKHEWLEDALRGQTTNAGSGQLNNTTDPVTATITSGDDVKFRAQDIVRVENELMRVNSTASNQLVLARAWGGTTNAAHSGTPQITLIAPAVVQGLTAPLESRTTTKTGKYNYTQIFEETVKESATNQETNKYTKQNDADYQISNQIEIIGTNMEKALLEGKKVQPTSSSAGAMDGIRAVISTNVYDKSGASLTQQNLEDAMQDIWTAGGSPSHIFANATQKRWVNQMLDGFREANYTDTKLGTMVKSYETDFGVVTVVLDRFIRTDEVLIITAKNIGFGPLRPLSTMPLPKTSKESQVWELSGEYTAEVRLEQSHALIKNLGTTAPA